MEIKWFDDGVEADAEQASPRRPAPIQQHFPHVQIFVFTVIF